MERSMHPTRKAILLRLKRSAELGVRELSEALDMTPMGVRQHLAALERQGLVTSDDVKVGRGRPRKVYRLTEQGHSLFPHAYDDLALSLLEEMEIAAGAEKVDQILHHRTQRILEQYRRRLQGKSWDEKLAELGRLRDKEGYLVDIEQVGPDTYALTQHHCAVHNVADRYRQLCSQELLLLAEALDAEVVRQEHIVEGDPRCRYVIRPRSG